MSPLSQPQQQQSQQQARPALRRATYVHVSDLTSSYNINHTRLEQELARAKAEGDATVSELGEGHAHAHAHEIDPTFAQQHPQRKLQPPKGGYNLCVLVGNVKIVVDKRRVDGSRVRLAEVQIGDETGMVSLRARDDQIDLLEEVSARGGAVVLRNSTLELYQGKHIRLAVTKWGKLTPYPDNVASTPAPPSKINSDRNFSLIDLSAVASEMIEPHHRQEPGYRPSRQSPDLEGTGGHGQGRRQSGHRHYQQSHSSTRRGSRGSGGGTLAGGGDRRQPRPKPSSGASQTYYRPAAESGAGSGMYPPQQQPHGQGIGHGSLRYQGSPMHGYPAAGYDPSMMMRQYPFPHARQQEMIPQISAHQLMMQQQYEIQQRQLQQLYQERHRQNMAVSAPHHMQQPAASGSTSLPTAGSFDVTSEYPMAPYALAGSDLHGAAAAGMPASSPQLTSMQHLIPDVHSGQPPDLSTIQPSLDDFAPAAAASPPRESGTSGQEQHMMTEEQFPDLRHLGAASPFSPPSMSAQASSYAPTYLHPSATPQLSRQPYFPFNPSQTGMGSLYPSSAVQQQQQQQQSFSHFQQQQLQQSQEQPSRQGPTYASAVSGGPRGGSGSLDTESYPQDQQQPRHLQDPAHDQTVEGSAQATYPTSDESKPAASAPSGDGK